MYEYSFQVKNAKSHKYTYSGYIFEEDREKATLIFSEIMTRVINYNKRYGFELLPNRNLKKIRQEGEKPYTITHVSRFDDKKEIKYQRGKFGKVLDVSKEVDLNLLKEYMEENKNGL